MPDDPPPPSHDTIHIGAGLGAVHVEADFGAGDADGDPIVIADTLLRQSLEADPDPTPDPAPDPLLDAMRRDGIVADPLVLPPPRQTYDEWMMTNLAPVRPFHRWDDTRLMVADIEKHARLSHGLTPDTDMLKRIADYIRESFGVTEADVPKP